MRARGRGAWLGHACAGGGSRRPRLPQRRAQWNDVMRPSRRRLLLIQTGTCSFKPGWEEEISNVAKKIMEEPSPRQLFVIRGKIRKLIEHNVSPYFIFHHLVTELKRGRDKEFQDSIDELASELNRCKECKFRKEQCKECKSRDTTLDMREINIEGFAKEGHDQGKTIQCFIMIEEFTVRFMSFYRSLIAKNSSRGGVP